jgi:uncharacterized protein YprB with RNaseH-like and TPR domain
LEILYGEEEMVFFDEAEMGFSDAEEMVFSDEAEMGFSDAEEMVFSENQQQQNEQDVVWIHGKDLESPDASRFFSDGQKLLQ